MAEHDEMSDEIEVTDLAKKDSNEDREIVLEINEDDQKGLESDYNYVAETIDSRGDDSLPDNSELTHETSDPLIESGDQAYNAELTDDSKSDNGSSALETEGEIEETAELNTDNDLELELSEASDQSHLLEEDIEAELEIKERNDDAAGSVSNVRGDNLEEIDELVADLNSVEYDGDKSDLVGDALPEDIEQGDLIDTDRDNLVGADQADLIAPLEDDVLDEMGSEPVVEGEEVQQDGHLLMSDEAHDTPADTVDPNESLQHEDEAHEEEILDDSHVKYEQIDVTNVDQADLVIEEEKDKLDDNLSGTDILQKIKNGYYNKPEYWDTRLPELDQDVYSDIKDNFGEFIGDKMDVPLSNSVEFVDATEMIDIHEAHGKEFKEGVLGFNNGDKSYVKVGTGFEWPTTVHETIHNLSSNDQIDENGNIVETRRGICIQDVHDQHMHKYMPVNEGITELFTKRVLGEEYPEEPYSNYHDNALRMSRLSDHLGDETIKEAYFQNRAELLETTFDNVLGEGAWEEFTNECGKNLSKNEELRAEGNLKANQFVNRFRLHSSLKGRS